MGAAHTPIRAGAPRVPPSRLTPLEAQRGPVDARAQRDPDSTRRGLELQSSQGEFWSQDTRISQPSPISTSPS